MPHFSLLLRIQLQEIAPPIFRRVSVPASISDLKHVEREEMKEWAGDFYPETFSLEAVNRRLARLKAAA